MEKTIYNVLNGNDPAAETIINISENLDLLPSHLDLSASEIDCLKGLSVQLLNQIKQVSRHFV